MLIKEPEPKWRHAGARGLGCDDNSKGAAVALARISPTDKSGLGSPDGRSAGAAALVRGDGRRRGDRRAGARSAGAAARERAAARAFARRGTRTGASRRDARRSD